MNRREYRYEIKNSKSSAIKSDLFLKVINFHYFLRQSRDFNFHLVRLPFFDISLNLFLTLQGPFSHFTRSCSLSLKTCAKLTRLGLIFYLIQCVTGLQQTSTGNIIN